MFKCQKCNKQSEAGEGQYRVVTATRAKTYMGGKNNQEIVGTGNEIAREISVGKCCATPESQDARKVYA